ncbi:MAG: carboxylating nicotinate-nucleotide diphosphorylase [Balneolales bacterium]
MALKNMSMNIPENVYKLIDLSLQEDIGKGDITTEAILPRAKTANARFIAKENGIIAGLEIAFNIFTKLDSGIEFESSFKDGEKVKKEELIATVSGQARSILIAERTVLNFMQRMSGVATTTRKYVDSISHTSCKVLDTRKTIPGHRFLDKYAVKIGGGTNHRARLDSMFLIKENHIAAAGGISQAIEACNLYANQNGVDAEIEIEVKNFSEIKQVLHHGRVKYILLDNMSIKNLKEAVTLINNRFLTEASGNVSLDTIGLIAETGVDFVSVGALTHSVKAFDISLIFD